MNSNLSGYLANENKIRWNMRNLTRNDSDWSKFPKIKYYSINFIVHSCPYISMVMPQWGKSTSARASVSLVPVLGARVLKTRCTICIFVLLTYLLNGWLADESWGTNTQHPKDGGHAPGSCTTGYIACFHSNSIMSLIIVTSAPPDCRYVP